MGSCRTTNPQSLALYGFVLLLLPLIALYYSSAFIYCKLRGKVFLKAEKESHPWCSEGSWDEVNLRHPRRFKLSAPVPQRPFQSPW